jgi:outer membrane protein OmpA-like peptidoglycan-associated protein
MKKKLLVGMFLIMNIPLWAQEIQWAFNVLGFSSQKDSKPYAAKQATGKPNVLPGSGESVNAWQCKGNKEEEFIKVGFFVPLKPKQVVIAESYNPGYISKVFVYDASGGEHEIASFQPGAVPEKSRLLHIKVPYIDFYVFAIKVVLRPAKNIPVAIDAIGIAEQEQPYEIKINQADVIKSNMVVKKLDRNVNSRYPEHGPLLAPDGKTLFFSRSFDPKNVGGAEDYEDIWYSNWDESTQNWGMSKNMGLVFNNDEPNYINSISPDGNTLLLGNSYSAKGTIAGGASIAYRTATGWSKPKRIFIEDEENINDRSNFYLSNSQKTLLQSVQRKKEGYGDRDLYVSFLREDSTWSVPLNLGANVNTLGTEAAPFLASDERTLYYASNGLEGYGGTDIYVTRRLDETWTKWSVPENLGPIVNTANNESYFTVTGDGNKVFYTSVGDSIGDVDIYTLALPEIVKPLPVVLVKGRVLDSKTNLPVPGTKIFFEDLTTGKEVGIASANPNTAFFEIMLPSGKDYGFFAQREGYIATNSNMELKSLKEYEEYNKDLYLTPIETGQSLILNNVFFPTKKADLQKESHLELDRLIKILIAQPTMKVEVSGHTDNIGSTSFNDFLSFQRAKAVSNYILQASGITPDRISVQYYGEGKPIADNNTEVGRQLNRRVEFLIISQ